MFRSLLVPLDGSPFAEHALPLALTIGDRAGAEVRLVQVAGAPADYPAEVFGHGRALMEVHLKKQQRDYLEQTAERLRGRTKAPVSGTLLDGPVAETLRRATVGSGVDLVVMTTHGRGSVKRLWLGSVADTLVKHVDVPLLLLRPHGPAADLEIPPELKRILVPLDGSSLAEGILPAALALAKLFDAEVHLLRIVPVTHPSYYNLEGGSFHVQVEALLKEMEEAQDKLRHEAAAYLERIAERIRADALRAQTHVAIESHVAQAILDFAAGHAADLIALETHGRGGLTRLVLGSVADKVLRGASVPVLLQRPAAV